MHVICEHAYARGSMLTHAFDLAGDHRAAFSIVLVGNQIPDDYLLWSSALFESRRTQIRQLWRLQVPERPGSIGLLPRACLPEAV